MKNPKYGMKPVRFKERKGDRVRKVREEEEAKAASLNLTLAVFSWSNALKTEKELLQKSISKIVKFFIFIQDHRCTLEPREKGRFNTPILQAIEDTDPDGVSFKNKRQVAFMKYDDLTNKINHINNALSNLPSWYRNKISQQSTAEFGDVLISELENIRIIRENYTNLLSDQKWRNFFTKTKSSRTNPTASNSDVTSNSKW